MNRSKITLLLFLLSILLIGVIGGIILERAFNQKGDGITLTPAQFDSLFVRSFYSGYYQAALHYGERDSLYLDSLRARAQGEEW